MTSTAEVIVGPAAAEATSVAWNGSRVLLTRPADNEILAHDPESGTTGVFRRFTGGVTGLAAGSDGRVYGCQTPSRRLVTYRADGSTAVLETKLDGRFHNFPRYATVDSRGRVWFADPRLGLRAPGPQVFPLLDHSSVLRLDPAADGSWTMARMTFDTEQPTVVALSNDESRLYVVDDTADGRQQLRAYPIKDDELGAAEVLATLTAQHGQPPFTGMALGPKAGHLILAGREGLAVLTPAGEAVDTIRIPGGATDVAIGAAAERPCLYVTSGSGCLLALDDIGAL